MNIPTNPHLALEDDEFNAKLIKVANKPKSNKVGIRWILVIGAAMAITPILTGIIVFYLCFIQR